MNAQLSSPQVLKFEDDDEQQILSPSEIISKAAAAINIG
jgi:hypothetical protein